MRNLFIIFAFVFISSFAFAQKETLALDEHTNKYIYYQVAEQSGTSGHQLFTRCLDGLQKDFSKKELKAVGDSQIVVTSKLLLNGGMFKHEEGEIAYKYIIEFRDGKYRYWLTDFVYTPYQRDRYNNYVPVPGKEVTLEQAKNKVDKNLLSNYMDQTLKYCKQAGENLKHYAANAHKQEEKTQKVDTRKW